MDIAHAAQVEKKGNDAVRQLRLSKHSRGLPFMINATGLPANQCYLEYPDGKVALVKVSSPTDRDFTLVRLLSFAEAEKIRQRFLSA